MHHMAVSYDKNILTFYNIGIDWITNVQYGGTRCFKNLTEFQTSANFRANPWNGNNST